MKVELGVSNKNFVSYIPKKQRENLTAAVGKELSELIIKIWNSNPS